MEKCIKSEMLVFGKSPRPYTVSRHGNTFSCTCVHYKYRGWCPHLEVQFNKLCGWEGEPMIPGICDQCDGPTEKVVVTEDDE